MSLPSLTDEDSVTSLLEGAHTSLPSIMIPDEETLLEDKVSHEFLPIWIISHIKSNGSRTPVEK